MTQLVFKTLTFSPANLVRVPLSPYWRHTEGHPAKRQLKTKSKQRKQETQISLTNRRTTRLEVSQGHQTCYHSIRYVWFPVSVLIVTLSVRRTIFEIFDFKNTVTLKTGLRVREGHWKRHHSI